MGDNTHRSLDRMTSNAAMTDTVVQIRDPEEKAREEFRTKLKSVTESQVKALAFSSLDSFMSEAHRYPRFAWQDFLLSFRAYQAHIVENGGENGVTTAPKFDADQKDNKGKNDPSGDADRDNSRETKGPNRNADGENNSRANGPNSSADGDKGSVANDSKHDPDTGRHGLQKLSHILDAYPDILQRELLRDSFHLVQPGPKIRNQLSEALMKVRRSKLPEDVSHSITGSNVENETSKIRERYGVLHAAVLLGRRDLVLLVRGPETSERIIDVLTPPHGTNVSSSFDLIRRAILWRQMHNRNASYAKVTSFLEDFKSALTDPTNEAIGTLIDKAARQIDVNHKSDPDPWIILLAWAKVWRIANPKCLDILEEFSKREVRLFSKILNSLRSDPCPLKNFLLEIFKKAEQSQNQNVSAVENLPEQDQKSVDHAKSEQSVEKLLELLIDEPGPLGHDRFNIMRGFFLDRLSERTPISLWSPLHLAAARGDDEMVRVLLESCNLVFNTLGDQVDPKLYITRLQESFYDSKDMTPLHYAVLGNNKRIVEYLLEWKLFQPCLNQKDIFKRTALQMACSLQDRASIVKHLVKSSKIDVNTKDCCSFTALHWAVYTESTDAVKFLVLEGENTNVLRATEKDNEGRHPYELAARLHRPSRKDIHQLLLSAPPVKDEVERLYRDRQVYVDAANAILVGAALIASVTFGGWLQPPLGDHGGSTDGMVRIFWAFSSLSFFFAIATVMAGATAVLPGRDEYIKDAVDSIRRWLAITAFLLILSVTCVLGAFAGGGYASASLVPDLNGNMTITTSIGGVVCGTIGLFFCYKLLKIQPDWNHLFKEKRESLSERKARWKFFLEEILQKFRATNGPIPSSYDYGPENSKTWDQVRTSLSKLSDRSTIPDFWTEMHREDGSCQSCRIRKCHSQLESYCLREALTCNGIQTEASLQEYFVMWKDLSSAPLFTGIKLTDKMRNVVKEIVNTQASSSRKDDEDATPN